jgi:hypothetical protein
MEYSASFEHYRMNFGRGQFADTNNRNIDLRLHRPAGGIPNNSATPHSPL